MKKYWFMICVIGGVLLFLFLMGDRSPHKETPPPLTVSASTTVRQAHFWKNFVKQSDAELRARLTPLEYEVTQHEGTERSFNNLYYGNEEEGIYVDIVSGEPLFSSIDKYDSGTGWPSFVKPISQDAVTLKTDTILLAPRTEVRSRIADSHLGHVFDDGPADRGGKRYCMNSASLRFVPKASLEAEGYEDYLPLFQK